MIEQKPIRAMAPQLVTCMIMIDKASIKVFIFCILFILSSYALPAGSEVETKNSSLLIPKIVPENISTLNEHNDHAKKEQTNSSSIDLQSDSERLKVNSTVDAKNSRIRLRPTETPMKPRKNKNDLFSFSKEFSRNKDRERNTKPPVVLKRDKIPESEEPYFERKPALLLRFFPDGTAVLISKFQLHLHVKPKEVKFGADEDLRMEDESYDYNPGEILNDGKSFEVSYKRLEAIPTFKEQNLEDDSDTKLNDDLYSDEDLSHKDHEFVTPSYTSTKSLEDTVRPIPFVETTSQLPETTTTTLPATLSTETAIPDASNKSEESTNNESPFFVMTVGQMSSLQQQYDPGQALPLKSISELQTERSEVSTSAESSTATTESVQTTPLSHLAAQTTDSNTILLQTDPTATTTRCLSFQNQLSLVLSTEDNIDNSLLKKHILPTQDCNNTEFDGNNELAKIQSLETTTIEIPTTTTPITTTKTVPTTTEKATTAPPQSGNLLAPYLASRMSVNPSKPDVVVVTSLPVLIDLKNRRDQAVTSVPSWREVTVGVVRDQQGQPLKPRYNNWTAHLRGLRKKSDNKFWNELTTPRNDVKPLPQQQPIQQAPSQINRAFWTDLQRDKQSMYNPPQRKNAMNTQPYVANPPKNYPTISANQFVVWRNREDVGDRWNRNQMESTYNNAFYPPHDIMRMKVPQVNVQQNFDRQENKPYPSWNNGNMQHSGRRW